MPRPTLPEWVEPMAATLTQERFTGPEWIFERKLDGIRLLAFKNGSGRPPAVAQPAAAGLSRRSPRAIAALPVHDVDPRRRGRPGARQSRSAYHVFDILWLDGRDVTLAAARRAARAAARAAALPRRSQRVTALDDDEAVGARLPRRLGRRHRQAARLALRASPLAALAEDEMRGVAGAGGRRIHRSAGRARRSRRAARRLLRGRRLRLRRKGRHRVRHQAAAATCARGSTRSRSRRRRSPRPPACRACARTGSRPEIVVQVAFIEWTVHGKLRHPRLLGVRDDKAAREVVRETP